MLDSSHQSFRRIAKISLLLLVGLPILILNIAGRPFRRGFFCDDDSIRYPYRESTIPTWLLITVGLLLPVTFIALVEWATTEYKNRLDVNTWLRECYGHVVTFFFGAGCTQLLTDVAKYTIGRLRPHFFAVCSPNIDCNDPKMKHSYVADFECLGESVKLIEDARLSFPSGHSSLASYSMFFLAMYCGARLVRDDSIAFIKYVIQYFAMAAAVYTGLTRISDYKHHWGDVLAGSALGTVTAFLTIVFVSELLPRRPREAASPTKENSSGEELNTI